MILLGQQNSFFRPREHFCYINRTVLLDSQRDPTKQCFCLKKSSFVAQITTKLFCCGNKIFIGQAKHGYLIFTYD